jgi:hypothetical protein
MTLYTQAIDRETIRFRNTLDRLHRLLPDILATEKIAESMTHAGLKAKATLLDDGNLAIVAEAPIDQLAEQIFLAKCVCLARGRRITEENGEHLILPPESDSLKPAIRLVIEGC